MLLLYRVIVMSLENPTYKAGFCSYTGVGSRETPRRVLLLMERMAYCLALKGLNLRTGGAPGADLAFEAGAARGRGFIEVFIPWPSFGKESKNHKKYFMPFTNARTTVMAERLAKSVVPHWDNLKQGARKLHSRNTFQVLGRTLNDPSDFCIGYAKVLKKDQYKGGTNTAFQLARKSGVQLINLAEKKDMAKFMKILERYENELGIDP